MVHVVGGVERKLARDEQVVVDLERVDAEVFVERVELGPVDHGTAAGARGRGLTGVLAGKTGTTNDGRDAWFVGFSPRFLYAGR